MNQLPLDDLTAAVARIRGLLLTEEKVDRAVSLLAQAIKESLPGTPGAGVSLMDAEGKRTSNAATDALVEQLDAGQYELGEGPCITAWAAGKVVIIDDLLTDTRWPRWQSAVASLPVRSVVSAPLIAGKETLGAFKIYSALPGQYDESTGKALSLFAETAATLLAHIQSTETPLRMSESLRVSLASRDTISRACGMLMERQGIGQDRALQQLIQNARVSGVTLVEASEQVATRVPPAGS
ncbi:GAF domain-containing protein [Arthrobacter ulcerisalmonis]|uniref:GAF and ANTAR domain-containing protein n=1 Tax=Arthrobacter sp. B1I2 TaxID=3042263 RepID=UPI0027812199|nr:MULTISPECIES: GAF and ANTAR domain-containing protein [Arthrobacter]MDQ0663138.1 GAF domain-containing protein [Arthrobacter ulcerisalmonis]MDQ0731044.1 GAF domain-containing protein [Arthrobacter sp. B1I2]